MDLATIGYVEEEYLVSGLANVYAWKNTTGRPRIKSSNCPYCTRIIVRKPADKDRFSGSVLVDLMHGGRGIDNPTVGWGMCWEHIAESGDGYVGVSVAGSTFEGLKKFDYERYKDLSLKNPLPPEERLPYGNMASSPDQLLNNKGGAMPDDPEREKGLDMDIFSQVAAMIKRGKPGTPFEGMCAKRAYLMGVTFAEIPCYVSAVLPYAMLKDDTTVYDGAVVYMSGRAGNLNREEDALSWDDPRTKCGGPVPVIRLQTAGDLRGTIPHPLWTCMIRSTDSDEPGNIARNYEVAGTSLRYCDLSYSCAYPGTEEIQKAGVAEKHHNRDELRTIDHTAPKVTIMRHIVTGIYRNLKDYSIKGIPLPVAPDIEITGGYPDTDFFTDEHGNQLGGVRTHYVDVPVATYLDDGKIIPFSKEKLTSLYGNRENWLKLVKARLDRMVEERWIVPKSAEELYNEAVEIGWPVNG